VTIGAVHVGLEWERPVLNPEPRVIVGFEVHVQLATRTKLFCPCEVGFGFLPNSRVCPVCLGSPGALPVLNREAVRLALLTAMALGCRIPRHTRWDRKSYYYPDLPKNYQISQYDEPVGVDGVFEIPTDQGTKAIGIIRAHLEEDAGKNLHDVPGCSLVDLNRTGTPLLEIVTRPDIASAEEAYTFCTELHRLVTYLGVSHGNMQQGQLRFEPNVNVCITENRREHRTPIAEVKNLNSFRAVRGAVLYELTRQVQQWRTDPGYEFRQRPNENRGWDDEREVTVFQRGKEQAHDYRYFPDPDLLPLEIDEAWTADIRSRLPELPLARRRRLMESFGLSAQEAASIVTDRPTANLFDAAAADGGAPKTLAKQFSNVWLRLANERGTAIGNLPVDAARVGQLARLVDDGAVSSTSADRIAERLLGSLESPAELAQAMGLVTINDVGQARAWVDEVLAANEKAVQDALKNPKKTRAAIGFLRGQVMKVSKGKADPKMIGEVMEARLRAMGDE